MWRVIKYSLLVLVISFFVLLGIFLIRYQQVKAGNNDEGINLCHSTSSESNPYIPIEVNKSGLLNGHIFHGEDIIPPFTYNVWEKTGSHYECPTSNSAYGSWWFGKTCKKKIGGHWKYAYPVEVDDYGWVEHQYDGKNWDNEGEAIWNNGCVFPEPEEVLGCTDPEALNYDEEANKDDGTCEYEEDEEEEEQEVVTEVAADTTCHDCSVAAPVCQDGSIVSLPGNLHVLRDGAKATVKYQPTGGDLVDVYFKEVGQVFWTHSKGDQPNNGYVEIDSLNPSLGYIFGVRQHQGCGSGETVVAVVIDGAVVRLFPMSSWQWSK